MIVMQHIELFLVKLATGSHIRFWGIERALWEF